jgi:membrane protease YdiL (CAAX protease family)
METSFLTIYIKAYVLAVIALWIYFFIYSYKHNISYPWGFGVTIAGLLVSSYGFAFYVTQVVFIQINFVFLVSLFGVILNIINVREQFYIQNMEELLRFFGKGLILGLLLGFPIRLIIGFEDLQAYPQYIPIAIVAIVIQVSIAEEIIHRGLFLKFLVKYGFKPMYAIAIQSLIFTAGHVPAYSNHRMALWIVLLFGVVANYLTWKTNNLIPAIVLHLTANLIGIVWWLVTTLNT